MKRDNNIEYRFYYVKDGNKHSISKDGKKYQSYEEWLDLPSEYLEMWEIHNHSTSKKCENMI